MSNQDPNVSEIARRGMMSPQQAVGAMLLGKGRPITNAQLPAAEDKAQTFMDYGMAVAGATNPVKSLHGTSSSFTKFDPIKRGANFNDPISKSATFFADNEKFARQYGEQVVEARLRAKSPLTINAEKELASEWKIAKEVSGYRGTFKDWLKTNAPDGPYGFYEMGLMNSAIADAKAAGKDLVTFDFGKLTDPKIGPLQKVHAVLDDNIIDIIRRYGLLGMLGGGAAAGGGLLSQEPAQ